MNPQTPIHKRKVKLMLPKIKLDRVEHHTTLFRLAIFVVLFAGIGSYIIFYSLASSNTISTLLVANMTLPRGAKCAPSTKCSSSGSETVNFTKNGTATGTVTVPSGDSVSNVSITASATSTCSTYPEFSVNVNGSTVIPSTTVKSSTVATYDANTTLNSGTYPVDLVVSNLHNAGKHCSRVFNAGIITFSGSTNTPAPTVTFSASPTTITTGSASTLTWSATAPTGGKVACAITGDLSDANLAASGSVSTGTLTVTSGATSANDSYTLTCTNTVNSNSSSSTATATVTVSASTSSTGGSGSGSTGSGSGSSGSGSGSTGSGSGSTGSGSGGTGSGSGSGGTTTGYTLPPTQKANGEPDQWYWNIDPNNSGVAGLPSITDTTYPAPGSANIWDTDLFEDAGTLGSNNDPNAASPVVTALHAQGDYSICYVEAGAYQTGFPDDSNFAAADYGSEGNQYAMQGWPGEWWFNLSGFSGFKYGGSTSSLTGTALNIATALNDRFEGCKAEGQNAIEPDDLDGYTNPSNTGAAGGGWGLTQADSAGFEAWIATAAHADGLAVFQKNDPANSAADEPNFDGMIIEECNYYDDPCSGSGGDATTYLAAGKPVLNAEYTQDGETTAKFCSADESAGITGALFDVNLDGGTYDPCED